MIARLGIVRLRLVAVVVLAATLTGCDGSDAEAPEVDGLRFVAGWADALAADSAHGPPALVPHVRTRFLRVPRPVDRTVANVAIDSLSVYPCPGRRLYPTMPTALDSVETLRWGRAPDDDVEAYAFVALLADHATAVTVADRVWQENGELSCRTVDRERMRLDRGPGNSSTDGAERSRAGTYTTLDGRTRIAFESRYVVRDNAFVLLSGRVGVDGADDQDVMTGLLSGLADLVDDGLDDAGVDEAGPTDGG